MESLHGLRWCASLVAALVTAAAPSHAQCQGWSDGFDFPGVWGHVKALAVFNDGTGRALYAGGFLMKAGVLDVAYIAKWDGTSWSPVGNGGSSLNNAVYALAVFNDGTGPALYAGGEFTLAGGGSARHIAKWNGTSWSPLGSGMNDGVRALAVFDDGTGPALFAGGDFTSAGGLNTSGIAKWDGTSWSALGNDVDDEVRALAVFDDGTGPALFAGGHFTTGISSSAIRKWDGASWSDLGVGTDDKVRALAAYDDGTGLALYAGGEFLTAGGVSASHIAKWDGATWSPVGNSGGSGMNGFVNVLTVFDDGTGPALFAGGGFRFIGGMNARRIAKWDGTSWSALGSGVGSITVSALAAFDDGTGSALFAGGSFGSAGGVGAWSLARWDSAGWSALDSGTPNQVYDLEVFDDGTGPALCAAVWGALKWDGRSWSSLGGYMNQQVSVLEVFDDGTGPALFAGGFFTFAGGVSASRIAKWNGASWSALGSGANHGVRALAVFDDGTGGTGPTLFAGGDFTSAGGVNPANHVAKWDGTSWSALMVGTDGPVNALTVFDDGTGPALFAGGDFGTASGVSASHISKWNGTSWSAVVSSGGNGLNGPVQSMEVFDDGTGPALFAAGSFTTAGGVSAKRIAKWDGTIWSALGTGLNNVLSLEVFDDTTGPALFAGGIFGIRRWDGTSWSNLGSGVQGTVDALTVFDHGADGIPELYIGGDFELAGGQASSNIAQWLGDTFDTDLDGVFDCADNCPVDFNPAQEDCDRDGLGDLCAIAGGSSMDANFNGLPDECEGTSYCTGKTNSLGCVPFMSGWGLASVTSPNPFQVMASDCLPNQIGYLLYAYTKSNVNFHGGTLCVKQLTVQFPGKFALATGSPPCSGILKSNMNKRIQSGVDPMLTAGAQVYAQWRQRDPNDPAGFGDSLTNGLTFVVQP